MALLREETKGLEEGVSKLLDMLHKSKIIRPHSEFHKETRPSNRKEDKSSSDGYQKTVRFSRMS